MKQTVKFASVLVGLMLFATVLAPVMAGPSEQAGKSNIRQLYLYEKNPSDWSVVSGGAWGKATIMLGRFEFNGHQLAPGTGYALIYYPDINKILTLDFECKSGCTGTWTHTMVMDTVTLSGFTGHGYFNADPSYTWTVTGTSKTTFSLAYTGQNLGYTVSCVNGACTGPGQTFTLHVTDNGQAIWPHPIMLLGLGTANMGGNVHIADNFPFSSIPCSMDFNAPGAKIWLVLSSDLSSSPDGYITGWQPSEYLFESELLTPLT